MLMKKVVRTRKSVMSRATLPGTASGAMAKDIQEMRTRPKQGRKYLKTNGPQRRVRRRRKPWGI